jgi:5-formyltetrahydrofolate cyclo-ligase
MADPAPITRTDGPAAEKARLRATLAARSASAEVVQNESAGILTRVLALPEFNRAQRLAVFLSLPGEPDTRALVEACHLRAKHLCVPAWRADRQGYGLARLGPTTPVAPARFHVPEPLDPEWVDARRLDLLLVPGVAFDAEGQRLGHGKGYYDRLLSDCPAAVRVGLALSSQLVERVPSGAHDVPMHIVITPTGTFRCDPDTVLKNTNHEHESGAASMPPAGGRTP